MIKHNDPPRVGIFVAWKLGIEEKYEEEHGMWNRTTCLQIPGDTLPLGKPADSIPIVTRYGFAILYNESLMGVYIYICIIKCTCSLS